MGTVMGIDHLREIARRGVPALEPVPDIPDFDEDPRETTRDLPVIRPAAQVTYYRQLTEAVRHAWQVSRRRVREEQDTEGTWIHKRKTENHSIQRVCDYAQSRAWVPAGHDGGPAEVIGVLYYALIGRPGTAYHLIQAWKYERLTRWAAWKFVQVAALLGVLVLTGHGGLAEITGGAALLVVAAAGAAFLPRRSLVGEPENNEEEGGDPE